MIKLFEKYLNIKQVKEDIFIKAIDTDNKEVIEFFIKKGYDINGSGVLFAASFNEDIFKYFLEQKIDIENHIDYDFEKRMCDTNIQKILIDFGYENLIYKTVGFNNNLRNEPKYADTIKRFEDVEKYNL